MSTGFYRLFFESYQFATVQYLNANNKQLYVIVSPSLLRLYSFSDE